MSDDVHLKPSIPDGDYVVEFISYYTAKMFGQTAKVCLRFGIVEGKYAGYELHQHHTVAQLYDDPGPKGRFKPKGQTCKLMVEFCTCFPDQKIERLDRIPMSCWEKGRFVARVRRVKKNHQQRDTPKQLQYSVIDEMVGPAGDEGVFRGAL